MFLFSSFLDPREDYRELESDPSSCICVCLYYFDWRDINHTPWFSSGITLGSRKTKLAGTDLRVDSDDIHQATDTRWSIPECLVETRVLSSGDGSEDSLLCVSCLQNRTDKVVPETTHILPWRLDYTYVELWVSVLVRIIRKAFSLNSLSPELRPGFPRTSLLCTSRQEIRKTIYHALASNTLMWQADTCAGWP